jgi:hypothetical protein
MNTTHPRRATTPLPCDRCLAVRPLSSHRTDWLCPTCNPDHNTCDTVAQAITHTRTWTCDHGVTYHRGRPAGEP